MSDNDRATINRVAHATSASLQDFQPHLQPKYPEEVQHIVPTPTARFASPLLSASRRSQTPDSKNGVPTPVFLTPTRPCSPSLANANKPRHSPQSTKLGNLIGIGSPRNSSLQRPQTPTNKQVMQEEPVDRSRDPWMDRKRRLDQEDASRYEEMYDGPGRRVPSPGRSDSRLGPPTGSGNSSRNGYSPRTQLPSINNLTSASDEHGSRDEADASMKRRRLADDADDRRRDDLPTPPGHHSIAGGRSPLPRRSDLGSVPPHSGGSRYSDEREGHEDGRSPMDVQFPFRSNGRASPLDDRARVARSPGSAMHPLPGAHDYRRPSVLTSNGEDGFEQNSSMPGLARRRGDAAQAKASRLHIDTGSSSASSFDSHALHAPSRAGGIAKSAPPQKLSFGPESMDPPTPYDSARTQGTRLGGAQHTGNYSHYSTSQKDQRVVSGSRLPDTGDLSRKESREDLLGIRDGPRVQDMPHTANPLARHPQQSSARGPGPGGNGYVPQTATLPSPAYHTTQFARGARPTGLNPPPTARLPDHLRSPPSSKAHFLSLFSDFYESLHDSRTLKATLEDQIKRSNTLLQTLQSSRRVLEETVERRVREERVLWEGRVRGLEARVRELEAKSGGERGSPSDRASESTEHKRDEEEKEDVDELQEAPDATA